MPINSKILLGQGAEAPPPEPPIDLTGRSLVDLGSSLDNLYFYYQMDEASGTLFDESANANSASVIVGTPDYDVADIVNEAGSVGFDGTVAFRDTTSAGFQVDGIWSFQCALNVTALGSPRVICHIGDFANSSNRGFRFGVQADGALSISGWDTAIPGFRNVITTATPITAGQDHLVHIVANGTDARFYVDGALVETVATGFVYTNNTTTPPVYIGAGKGSSVELYIDGSLGHVAMWNDQLTAHEVNRLAEAGGYATTDPSTYSFVELSGAGNWDGPQEEQVFDVLLVGGGGGGGSNQGGGGGAGGVRLLYSYVGALSGTFAYSVGAGGAGGPNATRGNGSNGIDTTFDGITVPGGGGGSGSTGVDGFDGGSGGGGDHLVPSLGGAATAVDPVRGNAGGDGNDGVTSAGGGGGGGAGGAGGDGVPGGDTGGVGGDGIEVTQFSAYGDGGFFASGGSAARDLDAPAGGGGGGTFSPSGKNALPQTGGGGGAGEDSNRTGGAGGSGTIVIRYVGALAPEPIAEGDVLFQHNTLLLPFNGTSGDTTTTDESWAGNDPTFNDGAQLSNGQKRFGDTSLFLDGSGDWLNLPRAIFGPSGDIDIDFDFTLEMWVYPTATNYTNTFQMLFSTTDFNAASGQGWAIQLNRTGGNTVLRIIGRRNNTVVLGPTAGSTAVPQDQWSHVAVVRKGASWKVYLDGVEEISATESANVIFDSITTARIGREGGISDSANEFSGYIDDFRLTKRFARYEYDFGTPTAAFPTTRGDGQFALNTLVTDFEGSDGSATATDYSDYAHTLSFNGGASIASAQAKHGSTSLSIPGGSSFLQITSPDADLVEWYERETTIEAWIRPTSLTGWSYGGGTQQPTMIGNANPAGTTNYWSFGPRTDGSLSFYYFNGSGQQVNSAASLIVSNVWQHIAAVIRDGNIYLYLDGQQVATAAISGTPQSLTTTGLTIGRIDSTSLNGYIDDLRVSRCARYEDAFSPPGDAVAVSGVSDPDFADCNLLLMGDGPDGSAGGIVDSSPVGRTFTTGGSVQGSELRQKYGSGSILFDASGDYLRVNGTPPPVNVTDELTIEGWVWSSDTTQNKPIWSSRTQSGTLNGVLVYWTDTINRLHVLGYRSGAEVIGFVETTQPEIPRNQWVHVAVTRDAGGTWRAFVNGRLGASSTESLNVTGVSTNYVGIDARIGLSGTSFFGHMDNMRFYRGVCKYTSNFYPPQPYPTR